MSSELERTAAERAIERALHAYCRGIDRMDGELIRSAYHDGATDDHGDLFRGDVDGYVAWVLPLLRERFASTMHTLTNITITLDDGDATGAPPTAARVESYLIAYHVSADAAALRVFAARYVDRFEHRPDAGWRIAHRTLVPEWQVEHSGQFVPVPPGAAPAARGSSDASY